ncbi:malate dehydrogenase [Pseudomassariella vexata]|uniref:Malate dehydrogenase n=1 Tax=Pseudomassariella vexata TaxID=1141098 RepID=A0A1Y2EL50_9PEZI|nr:malate dehydrogenase [Pseudomassariella vexata]ORY71595.1 malate dehydrogenase [Pseudomassariella vexata]
MRSSIILASVLGALTVLAAPTSPSLNLNSALPGQAETVTEYFNMLAQKVQEGRSMAVAPVCDLSKAKMAIAPTPLPVPAEGLKLKHVAIGRGTQNYTCDVTNATAVPAQTGAVATLFNASCVAATYPDLLNMLPKLAMSFNLTEVEQKMGPSNLAISGQHFFTNTTTPFFNLDTTRATLGEAGCTKANATSAPANAPKGQLGEPAVPWLKLVTHVGATGNLQEVYRIETAGGSAPATCKGMPATFEVQYSAQYWFFEGTAA